MPTSDYHFKIAEATRRRREAEDRLQEAERNRLQQERHHGEKLKMDRMRHFDDMRAKERSDAISAMRVRATEEHNRKHLEQTERFHKDELETIKQRHEVKEKEINANLKINADRVAFDREKMELERETAADIAFLNAKTSYEIAYMQEQGALMLAAQNHNHAMVIADIDFRQRLAETVLSHIIGLSNKLLEAYARNTADITAIRTNEIHSIYERTKNTVQTHHIATTTAYIEKLRHKHATEIMEQEETRRENERRHEIRMAILQSGLKIDEMTKAEFIRYVLRMMEGITGNAHERDAQKWASDCFDEWERERARKR